MKKTMQGRHKLNCHYFILLHLPQTKIINWTMTTKLFFSHQRGEDSPCEHCILNILCFVRCASMLDKRNAHQCLLLSDRSLLPRTQSTRKKISYWTGNRKCISAIAVTFFSDGLLCSCHLLSIPCIACQSPGHWTSQDLLPLFSTPLCYFLLFFVSKFHFQQIIYLNVLFQRGKGLYEGNI